MRITYGWTNHLEELVAIFEKARRTALISTKPVELNEGQQLFRPSLVKNKSL